MKVVIWNPVMLHAEDVRHTLKKIQEETGLPDGTPVMRLRAAASNIDYWREHPFQVLDIEDAVMITQRELAGIAEPEDFSRAGLDAE